MSELSGGEMRNNNHQVVILYLSVRFKIINFVYKIARSSEHKNRQTRGLAQPLGFFGKIAYVGGLLFQVT